MVLVNSMKYQLIKLTSMPNKLNPEKINEIYSLFIKKHFHCLLTPNSIKQVIKDKVRYKHGKTKEAIVFPFKKKGNKNFWPTKAHVKM